MDRLPPSRPMRPCVVPISEGPSDAAHRRPAHLLRPWAHPPGREFGDSARPHCGRARPQWRRQDHHAALDHRLGVPAERPSAARRPGRRGLAADPKVMLLDEPSQGLAPLVVEELTRLIARLRDEGVSLLLVEQNLKLAEAVADVIYVMVKGKMVYDAPLERFRHEREDVKAKYLTL